MIMYYEIYSFEGYIVIWIIEIDFILIVIREIRLIGFLYIK